MTRGKKTRRLPDRDVCWDHRINRQYCNDEVRYQQIIHLPEIIVPKHGIIPGRNVNAPAATAA